MPESKTKKHHKIGKTILIGLAVFIVLLIALKYIICFFCYNFSESDKNLSAEETIVKYFDYWDKGNEKGMDLLATDEFDNNLNVKWYQSFSYADFFTDIEISQYKEVTKFDNETKKYLDEKYDEYKIYLVNFNTSKLNNIRDAFFINNDWRTKGFRCCDSSNFVLTKDNNGEWKLADMYCFI